MSAYDVMDGLLRTSLVESVIVEDDSPPSDLQVELGLIEEGDVHLLGLWYAVTGRSALFEDDNLPSWMVEGVLAEREQKDIDDDIKHHEKALAAVLANPERKSYDFSRGKEGEEKTIPRTRDQHIAKLQHRLKGLHAETPAGHQPIPTPLDRRSAGAKLSRPTPTSSGPWSPPSRTSSGEGGHPEKPWTPGHVSDDPKSAYHVPLSSEPGRRGLHHRGTVTPVPPLEKDVKAHKAAVKKAHKKGLPIPAPLPKKVVRALPGQAVTPGTGNITPRFSISQGMFTTRDKPVATPERTPEAAKEAAKKLKATDPDYPREFLAHPLAIHTAMHTIAGIKDPRNLTKEEHGALAMPPP